MIEKTAALHIDTLLFEKDFGANPQVGWQIFREYRMWAAGRLVHCRCEGR